MRKIIAILAVLLIFAGFCLAQEEIRTIRGRFIDVRCYVHHGGGRDERCRQCVMNCLKAGNPGGILEKSSGKIYLVVSDDMKTSPIEKLLPYFAKDIEVKGIVREGSGVYTITVMDVKEIPPAGGMMEKKDSDKERKSKGPCTPPCH